MLVKIRKKSVWFFPWLFPTLGGISLFAFLVLMARDVLTDGVMTFSYLQFILAMLGIAFLFGGLPIAYYFGNTKEEKV